MVYYGSSKMEMIMFHADDESDLHWIKMERDCEEPIFYVNACCDDDWEWVFYDGASNYDIVKHMIMDTMFSCDDMDEVMDALDDLFEDCFADIVVDDGYEN